MPTVLAAPWLGTAIAGVAGAGGAVAAGKIAANATTKGAKLSTEAANRAAELQDAASQRAEAFQREQAAQDQARFEASQRANYAQYVNRVKAAQGLGRTIGFDLPDPPAYESSLPPTSGRGATGSPSSGGSAVALKTLLDQGMDPQKAAAQFNQQYGRTTGNEAVYYDPSQHGGVAAIGLPDAYLSLEPHGWSITERGGSSSPMGSRSIATAMSNRFTIPTPQVEPFQLRSINAFVKR